MPDLILLLFVYCSINLTILALLLKPHYREWDSACLVASQQDGTTAFLGRHSPWWTLAEPWQAASVAPVPPEQHCWVFFFPQCNDVICFYALIF